MAEPLIKLIFNRKKTATREKTAPVEIRVTLDRRQKYLGTGVSLYLGQWDAKKQEVVRRSDAYELNKRLAGFVSRTYSAATKLPDAVCLERIRDVAEREERADITFTEYIRDRIERRNIGEDTRKRYRAWLAVFERWGGMHYFHEVTARNINAFGEYVAGRVGTGGGKFKQGTVYNYHAALRSFINDAVTDEYVAANPYNVKRIKIDKGAKRHVDTLSPEQVADIERLDYSAVPCLERVRDCFLFQCYTGMCYVDAAKFSIFDCKDVNGHLVMRANRQKTQTEYMFLLLPKARALAEKYGGRLPFPCNQVYNRLLKVIGHSVGEPGLHSHMGRASCATIMRNAGLTMSVIQKVLGHTTLAQTERYASLMDSTVIEEMRRLK